MNTAARYANTIPARDTAPKLASILKFFEKTLCNS